MTMILDVATKISSPSSFVLFDDTSGSVVHYLPCEWRLSVINGAPQISYLSDKNNDVAFLSMVLSPWIEQSELNAVKVLAEKLGIAVQPARYLGNDGGSNLGTKISFPYDFPDDPKFRCKVNGGQGGAFGNPIPLVISSNFLTGQILAKIANKSGPSGVKGPGIIMQLSSMLRGATTTFHAVVSVDYDRTYEMFSMHTSWSWWVWSGDIQAAWQELIIRGAVKVEILGGTADQKTIAYKMAEWLRDMFFKPELGTITQPTHPNRGIINTSLRYEKIHEHKTFKVEFNERDFTDAPFACAVSTGQVDIGVRVQSTNGLEQILEAAAAGGIRPSFDSVPKFLQGDFFEKYV